MSVNIKDILDFIPYYPELDDDAFTKDITRKKEYQDYRLEKSYEDVPSQPGVPLPHQILAYRYFSHNTPYKKGIIFQGMGSGKCVSRTTKILANGKYTESQKLWYDFVTVPVLKDASNGEWSKPISPLKVVSYDFTSDSYVEAQVANLYRELVFTNLRKLIFETTTITITCSHKLCDEYGNWTENLSVGKKYRTYVTFLTCVHEELKHIEEVKYWGYVYDFEVYPHHNYVAEGVLCHNTCIASLVVEHNKKFSDGRALILVRNEDQIKNYQDEIIDVCTKDVYFYKYNKKQQRIIEKGGTIEVTEESKRKRIIKSLSSSYEFHTFDFLKKLPSDDTVRQRYSNKTIIIDEAHWLRKQKGKEEETKMYYSEAHRLLHNVDNCIILLMTGTPIWDNVSEIASLSNLILDSDKQLPTGKKFIDEFFEDDKLIKKDVLKKLLRGKISYLRSSFSDIIKLEIGVTKPWLENIIVFPAGMSDFQYKYYKEAEEQETTREVTFKGKTGKETIRTITTKGGTIYKLAKDASNFVYPIYNEKGDIIGGGYGKKYFDEYCVKKTKKWKMVDGINTPFIETKYEITNKFFKRDVISQLRTFSAKFAFVIEDMKKHPNEITFTYMGESVTRAGAILLGLCMKEHGFEIVKNASQLLTKSQKSRVAIITSNINTISTAPEINKVLKILGNKSNVNGDYIRHIIGSEKISMGVSIKNAKKVYDLSSHWNTSHKEQAIFRIFRFGSHKYLEDKTIRVFRVVGVKVDNVKGTNKGKGFPEDVSFSKENTIDVYTYQTSESKDKFNSQIHRLLKQIAWDCALNYKGNVSPNDIDGSRECDFKKCNYVCDGYESPHTNENGMYEYSVDKEDTSSFNSYYARDYIQFFKIKITELFSKIFSSKLDAIMHLIGVNNSLSKTLLIALDELIEYRTAIRNRYGVNSFLKEKNNVYFLTTGNTEPKYTTESLYCSNFLSYSLSSLDNILLVDHLQMDEPFVKELCSKTSEKEISSILKKCHYTTVIMVLETAFTVKSETTDTIKTMYKNEIHHLKIDDVYVYLHTMYYTEYTGIGYGIANKKIEPKGLTRIFSGGEWNYIDDPLKEKEVLDRIKSEPKSIVPSLKTESGISGIIDKTGKFKLYFHTEGGGKKKTRGRVCESMSREKLLDIFMSVNYLPPASRDIKELSKKDISIKINNLPEYISYFSKFDLEDIGIARKIVSLVSMSIPEMCKKLKKWFDKNNYIEKL